MEKYRARCAHKIGLNSAKVLWENVKYILHQWTVVHEVNYIHRKEEL